MAQLQKGTTFNDLGTYPASSFNNLVDNGEALPGIISEQTNSTSNNTNDKLFMLDGGTGFLKNMNRSDFLKNFTDSKETIAQASHGFVSGDVLKLSGSTYAKAQGDTLANAKPVGIVESVVDSNNFIFVRSGKMLKSSHGFTGGAWLYLSPTSAGALTASLPSLITYPSYVVCATAIDANYLFVCLSDNPGLLDSQVTAVKLDETVRKELHDYGTTAGTTTAYTLTPSPAFTSYTEGMVIRFTPNAANVAGPVTINVNALGAKTIKKWSRLAVNTITDLEANDLLTAGLYEATYTAAGTFLLKNFSSPQIRDSQPLIILQHQATAGTNGGTFTSGAFQTRPLSTEVVDTHSLCTLATNQFTLQPGSYLIQGHAMAIVVNHNQLRIRNITDSTTSALGEVTGFNTNTCVATVDGYISLSSAKTFELQHQCETTRATDGFGSPFSIGTEVYATVTIRQLAPP